MIEEPERANQPSDQSKAEATDTPRDREIPPEELEVSTLPEVQTAITEEPEQANPPFDQLEVEATDTPRDQEIPPDELEVTLEQHRNWVESNGKDGNRANLKWAHSCLCARQGEEKT